MATIHPTTAPSADVRPHLASLDTLNQAIDSTGCPVCLMWLRFIKAHLERDIEPFDHWRAN